MKQKLPWLIAGVALAVALVALLVALRSASLTGGYVAQLATPVPTNAPPSKTTSNAVESGPEISGTGSSSVPSPVPAAAQPQSAGNWLAVRLVDPSGKPVPNATVRLIYTANGGRKVTSSAQGDAAGSATVRGVAAPQVDVVSVDADGFERSEIATAIPLPLDEILTITMTPLAGTRIRLLTVSAAKPDGEPYEGPATVYLQRRADDAPGTGTAAHAPSRERYETVEVKEATVRAGSVQVDQLPPGTYRVAAAAGVDYAESDPFSVQADVGSEATIVLGQRQLLSVSVLETGTRQPVAGATVRLRMTSRPAAAGAADVPTASTGVDGSASFPDLAPGTYAAEASAPGFATKTVEEVRVAAGPAPPPLTISVARGNSAVAVTVTGADGRPVARAPLVLFAGGAAGPRTFFGQTDDGGAWRFDPVPAGRYMLSANHPESRSRLQRTAEVVVGDAETRQVSISFGATQSLQGRARRDGKPYEGLVSFVGRSSDATRHYARADSNGDFVAELEPGEYIVGSGEQPGRTMVTVVPGQTALEVDIR